MILYWPVFILLVTPLNIELKLVAIVIIEPILENILL
jgi:hypothetical protein